LALQRELRIPIIQQVLLVGGTLLKDGDLLDAHIPPGVDNFEVFLIRSNPTRKLYWKIALKEPQIELRTLVASRGLASWSTPPYFHVKLLDLENPESRSMSARFTAAQQDSAANEHLDSVLEGLSGEEVEFSLEALVETGPLLLGIVRLPDHLPGAFGQEALIHIKYDLSRPPRNVVHPTKYIRSLCHHFVTLPEPMLLRGFVELKYAWSAQPPSGFFSPSKPSTKTRETKYGLRDSRQTFRAEIIEGQFVYIKKHSCMNCAMIGFKVQGHRDSLLARFSREPLSVGVHVVDFKPHVEKQDDGSRVEVPSCAFAAWPKTLFCSVLELRQFFDHLCECCHEGAAAEVTTSTSLSKPQVLPADPVTKVAPPCGRETKESGKGRRVRRKGKLDAEQSCGKQGQQDRASTKGKAKSKCGLAKGGQRCQKGKRTDTEGEDASKPQEVPPDIKHSGVNGKAHGKSKRDWVKGKGSGDGCTGGVVGCEYETDLLHDQLVNCADSGTKGSGNTKQSLVKGKKRIDKGTGRGTQGERELGEEQARDTHTGAGRNANDKGQGKANDGRGRNNPRHGHTQTRIWQPKMVSDTS